jgi:high-affinity Fe2+/Pb2+ permease
MNLLELVAIVAVVAIAVVFVVRVRRAGLQKSTLSTTNVLLAIIIGMGSYGFYLYTEAENREAIRTSDMSRCWHIFTGSACSTRIAAEAAKRLSRGY